MNKDQMEMLSVKSAIERTVQSQISAMSTRTYTDPSKDFFVYVERYIAGLFASGQIEDDYVIHINSQGNLQISFSARNQKTGVTFMLPNFLKQTRELTNELRPVDKPLVNSSNLITQHSETRESQIKKMLQTSIDTVMFLGFGNTDDTCKSLINVCTSDLGLLKSVGAILAYSVTVASRSESRIGLNIAFKFTEDAWVYSNMVATVQLRDEKQPDAGVYVKPSVPVEHIDLNLVVEPIEENVVKAYDKAMKGI